MTSERGDGVTGDAAMPPISSPAVSVIISTRNRADSLERCLRAIDRDTSRTSAEVVVVDNGSTDDTHEVLARLASQLSRSLTVAYESTPGLSRARNAGVRVARGRIMLFTDDDVVVRDGWIDAIADGFAPGVVAVGGRIIPRFLDGCPSWLEGYASPATLVDYGAESFDMHPGRLPIGANMAFRGDFLRSRLPEPFEVSLGHSGRTGIGWEETHLLVELAARHRIVYAPAAVAEHWIEGSRWSYPKVRKSFYQLGFGLARHQRLSGMRSASPARRLVRLTRTHRDAVTLALHNARASEVDGAAAEREFLAFMWAGSHVESLLGAVPIVSERVAQAFPARPLIPRCAYHSGANPRARAKGDFMTYLGRLRAAAGSAFRGPPPISPEAAAVLAAHLTYLSPERLVNIEWALESVVRDGVPGSFLEAGVAQGGSAIVIAGHLDGDRRFDGYDVFEMIPSPGERDPAPAHQRYADISAGRSEGIAGQQYYGYRDDLLAEVTQAFREHGVPVDGTRIHLHRGLFEATLHPTEPVAFAHIDCDWYEPVYSSLQRIYPVLSVGGFIILDDYYDWGGAKQAVDAFLQQAADLEVVPGRPGNHLILRRASHE